MDYLILIGIGVLLVFLISLIIYEMVVSSREKRKLEKEIAWIMTSREQFKILFEESPVPYFILNNKGEIKNLNKAALRFFQMTPDEILLKNLFSFAFKDDADYASYLLTYCERNLPINNKELRMASKNGEIRWVRLSSLELTEANGSNLTRLTTLLDITEEKNLDKAKTEFVSLASHQLRAPLATVKWYTEMLTNTVTGELNIKQKEYLKVLNEVNTDMIELVDTLLNVSRSEIGKLTVSLTTTNVQEITDSILTELSSQIDKKKMNIIKKYNDVLTNIKSDPKLLRIIIHNLISNAIKYTPDGGNILINFYDDNGRSRITVTDTGYGIPKQDQEKIFTKLFRAENVKEISSSQSTGLGLYLVQSLVKTLGGEISFVSEENKGTTFTITL